MGTMAISFNAEKFFHWCLFIFLTISTFFYRAVPSNVPISEAVQYGYMVQELFFRYGAVGIYCLAMFLSPIRQFKEWYFVVFFLYCFFSSLFGFDISVRRAVLNIFIALLFYKTVIEKFNFKYFRCFCYFSIFIISINLIMMVLQYFGKDPIFTGPPNIGKLDSLVGLMKLKVNLGILGAVLSPFLLHLSPIYLILSLPLLIFGFSSSSIAAFVSSTLLISFLRNKKLVFTLLFVTLLSFGLIYVIKFDMPTGQFGERLDIWERTISYTLKSNIFFGSGLGFFSQWEPLTNQITNSTKLSWIWAHNEYIQAFFEIGAVGLGIIVFYIFSIAQKFVDTAYDRQAQTACASLLTILIISFYHFPFHVGRFAPLFIFLMAIFQAKAKDLEDAV